MDARKIEVEKRNPGIAWGAVYAEYESPIKDVKQQGGELPDTIGFSWSLSRFSTFKKESDR